jgi:hypothetical protein
MIQLNLGNILAHINIQDDFRNFSSSKMYMAAVSWTKMAKLYLEKSMTFETNVDSLRNLLPDQPVDNVNRVSHDPAFFEDLQFRINQDSYTLDDSSPPSFTRRLHSYDEENPRYQSSALGDEEENNLFPYKVTCMKPVTEFSNNKNQ